MWSDCATCGHSQQWHPLHPVDRGDQFAIQRGPYTGPCRESDCACERFYHPNDYARETRSPLVERLPWFALSALIGLVLVAMFVYWLVAGLALVTSSEINPATGVTESGSVFPFALWLVCTVAMYPLGKLYRKTWDRAWPGWTWLG